MKTMDYAVTMLPSHSKALTEKFGLAVTEKRFVTMKMENSNPLKNYQVFQ